MNQDCRTVKSETEKVNDLLTNISTNDITELNDLNARAKLVSEKSGFHGRPQTESQNPGGNSNENHR